VKEEDCSKRAPLLPRVVVSALALAATLVGSPHEASAQQYFTLDRMLPSGAPDDGFMVIRPRMAKETRVYVNGITGFALDPLRDESVTEDSSVQRALGPLMYGQVPLHLSAGIEILGRFGFNLSLPFYPLQIPGSDPAAQGIGSGGVADAWAGAGDPRIDARFVAFTSRDKRTSFGAVGGFTVPMGSEGTFGGDTGWTGLLLATAEHNFGSFVLNGNIGPHFKPPMSIGGRNGDLTIGNELRYSVGAFIPFRQDRLRFGVEFWGSTNMGDQGQASFFGGRNTTVEWLAQGRATLDQKKRFYINAGVGTRLSGGYGAADLRVLFSFGTYFQVKDFEPESRPAPDKVIVSRPDHYDTDTDGDGYPDGVDQCPDEKEDYAEPKPGDGCPAPLDRDKDGVSDKADKCPDQAEDMDDVEDEDGCPEEDADHDKVDDDDDACPLEPGPPNKDEELNGCPTLTKMSEDGKIEILTPIEFDPGTAIIKPTSLPIVEEVVTLLLARPELRVAIYGHTDDKGGRDKNISLSRQRADSVRKVLEGKGVAPARLEADGFGPDKPIESNATQAGRAKNRRVEFVVLGQPGE